MKSLEDIKKHINKSDKQSKRHAGFEVPDGYFDALKEELLAKAKEETPTITRKINWFRVSAAAASVCVLIACLFLLINNSGGDNANGSLAMSDLSIEESYDFILAQDLEDISTDDILDLENIDEILDELEEELAN